MSKKILFRPVRPFHINQSFGENQVCISNDGKNRVVHGCDGKNPPKGYRSLYGRRGHLGIDLRARRGQEVYCAQEGIVYKVDTDLKSGLDVRIESEVNGERYRHIYEHLLGYQHAVGAHVKTGQLIGWADNTGYSSGDHLHFQVEKYDKESRKWKPVDPMPLMAKGFAKDILSVNHQLKYLAEEVARLADNVADFLRSRI